ncbi:carbohydrate-binding module family 12 protein [Trametes polyzona]|nr:carbohydrate-binding module family 12 protein [Trametes polyzona]
MVYQWEPGTFYDLGTIVEYQGHKYKIVQAHQSEPGWEPPATPALWGRLPEDYHEQHQEGGYNPGCQQPPQQPYGGEKPHYDQPPPQQQVPIHEEERKTGWDSLSDDRKKQIEIGGGLLAGIAAIGAGYFAYHEHEKNEDEKKANIWALQNWLHEAEQRTRDYYEHGPRGPATWVLVEDKNRIPTNIAIVGGEEHGQPHYICRGFHEGSLQIGKASSIFQKGAVIGYGHKEIHLPKFEVLVGDMRALRWVDWHGRVDLDRLGARPVEGGREADGTPLFIAQAHHHGAIVPGKCSPRLDAAFVPYASTEKEEKNYRILCYA